MAIRVQVLMAPEEREAFRRQAREAGMSLSAWLRQAGLEKAERASESTSLRDPVALRAFFASCDRLEGLEPEPDWAEHSKAIDLSRRGGLDEA